MGIFIHISISKAVTKCEWEKVYEETLQLVEAFPLAERRTVKCHGIDTICLVPTVEREETYGRNDEKIRKGWFADGDYDTLHTAEKYSLYRDMICDDEVESDAQDALLGALPAYLNYDWDDPRCNRNYDIWGSKTQGEPYHMYLLAIACLIEARLGEKAFVYGDITRGQCKKAVELANEHLQIPIDIPDRCDMERFYRRVSKLQFSEEEKFVIFNKLYLGKKDSKYGEYIRNKYTEDVCNKYWKKYFGRFNIGTLGFDNLINEYLWWGFDLGTLCGMVKYCDEENEPRYEEFVKRIMDAKLHLQSKNCEDILAIDQDEEEPYGIYNIMAQLSSARNKKVDRYIPMQEIKEILNRELGDRCNVNHVIEEYMQNEKQEINISEVETEAEIVELYKNDAAEVYRQAMEIKNQLIEAVMGKYDIITHEDLLYYKKGDSIEPHLMNALKRSFVFYNNIVEEEPYKILMEESTEFRSDWLVKENKWVLIRDKDWNKILSDIEENKNSFARYYPMVRLRLNNENLVYMAIAIVLNDELYSYCNKLIREEC